MKECEKIQDRIDKRWVEIRKIAQRDAKRAYETGVIKTPDKMLAEVNILEDKNADDWEIYLSKIPTQEILKELDKLPEYEYPTEQSSIFLLPNGKMVGSNVLFNHHKVLVGIISVKLSTHGFFKHLVAMRIVRLTVDDSVLYININIHVTKKQKAVLKKLRKSKKYKEFVIDTHGKYTHVKTKIKTSMYYEYDILGLKRPK